MRRLGHWLALLAIALQAAWPLIAAAKPRSVELVPLCTVEGITHYVEVPTGKSPVDGVHGQHCAFCTLGVGAMLPPHADVRLEKAASDDRVAPPVHDAPRSAELIVLGARAPPFFPEVLDG